MLPLVLWFDPVKTPLGSYKKLAPIEPVIFGKPAEIRFDELILDYKISSLR